MKKTILAIIIATTFTACTSADKSKVTTKDSVIVKTDSVKKVLSDTAKVNIIVKTIEPSK
jgi:hypothetical protein